MALITGTPAQWLEQNREELNTRFRVMRRRFPQIEPTILSLALADVLNPIQGASEAHSQLYSSLYDLVLLHTGRGALRDDSGLSVLLKESFSSLAPFLLEQPKTLPGALSNAVENLGVNGSKFAKQLVQVAKYARSAQHIIDAGALLAWRLGEARLRERALKLIPTLPARAVLESLYLSSWHEDSLPFLSLSLQVNSWRHPDSLFTDETLQKIPGLSPSERATLRHQLIQTPLVPPSSWRRIARVGDFVGFGGQFLSLPIILQNTSKHQILIESAGKTFVIYADMFGSVCHAEDVADPTPNFASPIKDKKKSTPPALFVDGTLQLQGSSFQIPLAQGAGSYALFDNLLIFSSKDSLRLSFLMPHQERM